MPNTTLRPVGWCAALALCGLLLASCRTSPPVSNQPSLTRIAVVSDVHVNSRPKDDERLYPGRLDLVIQAVNAAKVDLVLMPGDLTEHGTAEEFAAFRKQIQKFRAPVWLVPGNHDVGGKPIKGNKDAVTLERVKTFEAGCGPSYFVREQSGVRVVGLTASLLGSDFPLETKQWDFLEKQLAVPSPKPTLLLLHYPPYQKSPDEGSGDYFDLEPQPRARLLALARQGGVKAILTGHLHHPLTNHLDNIVLLSAPSIAVGLPKGKVPEAWFLLSVSKDQFTWDLKTIPVLALPKSTNGPTSAPK